MSYTLVLGFRPQVYTFKSTAGIDTYKSLDLGFGPWAYACVMGFRHPPPLLLFFLSSSPSSISYSLLLLSLHLPPKVSPKPTYPDTLPVSVYNVLGS
jgi:hypothetical protein